MFFSNHCNFGSGVILPNRFLMDNLSVSGSLLVFSFGSIILMYKALPDITRWVLTVLPINETLVFQLVLGFISYNYFVTRICPFVGKKCESFLYFSKNIIRQRLYLLIGLYVTLSAISFFLVIYRNIR